MRLQDTRKTSPVILAFLSLGLLAPSASGSDPETVTVPQFDIAEQPLYQCLWSLANEVGRVTESRIMFILESAEALFEQRLEVSADLFEMEMVPNTYFLPITISTSSATLEEILDLLVEGDPKFAWEYDAKNNVVNVIDGRLKRSPLWFLNRPVAEVTIGKGDGVACLDRIAREQGIPFQGPSSLRGEKPLAADYVHPGGEFRSLVNGVLSRTRPDGEGFFLITCVREPEGELTEEWASSTKATFYGFAIGFERFGRRHREKEVTVE